MPRSLWLAWLLGLGVGWFLFAGQVGASEVAVGAVAVGLSVLLTARMARLDFAHFSPNLRWLLLIRHLPGQVLRDTLSVTGGLGRRLVRRDRDIARFGVAPFAAGGADPQAAARRTLAVFLTSLPPNSYVVDIDPEQNRVLYNELAPQGTVPDPLRQLEVE